MEMKGNVVAFPSIYFVWVGLVLSSLLFRLQYSTVLSVPKVGRSPTVLLSGSHTLAPIGRTALRACATGSHPKVTPRDGSPSPRAVHIDRTHSHGRARANVPWDGRDAHGTAQSLAARARVHTPPTGPLRGPLRGLAPGQRAYSAACRSSSPTRAARARNASCSRPSRCRATTGPAATASIVSFVASSHARTAAAIPPRLSAATT